MGITGPNVPRRMLEAFQMMLDLGPDDADVRAGNVMYGPNRWPADAPRFRAALEDYYGAATALSHRLLGAFGRGLELPEEYFRPFFRKPLTQSPSNWRARTLSMRIWRRSSSNISSTLQVQ